ncbi:PQQ-dependent sugar dehydrogenase [Sphingobacterium sp. NPDC055431]
MIVFKIWKYIEGALNNLGYKIVQFSFIVIVSFMSLVSIVSCNDTSENENQKPEENRFIIETLAVNLDEPIQMDILKNGDILFVERKGRISLFHSKTNKVIPIGHIPVSVGYYDENGKVLSESGEDGMLGGVVDPNFESNGWIYLYYSPKGLKHYSILARFEIKNNQLVMASKKVLLEIPNQRISCCHLGGGMLFDQDANLYLSTGDNTPNDPRGYSPLDERSGRSLYDSQRTAANSNDLRGKILRIHPNDDGTYSIPQGNLFPIGTADTRPEIYTMGNRNPWRLSIDSETGWLFWGEVGPTGIQDSIGYGPKSYDEFNIARGPGNFGWPYIVANQQPYWRFDYANNKPLEKFIPEKLKNLSPNNTGIIDLPEAQPAFIWYPQMASEDFPLLGSGSNSAVGGPVYRKNDFQGRENSFPYYYEGKWFITDWTRGWIFAVTFDKNGKFLNMEPFLEKLKLNGPIDMKFGPNGDLFVLEYGRGTYKKNADARLLKITYQKGNRNPIARITPSKAAGEVPFNLSLSAEKSEDYDNDHLEYHWELLISGKVVSKHQGEKIDVKLDQKGKWVAKLTVVDEQGNTGTEKIQIQVGNAPPSINLSLGESNETFFFPNTIVNYEVTVMDKEDEGSNGIDYSNLNVNAEYIDYINFDLIKDKLNATNVNSPIKKIIANDLILKSDCKSCHAENEKLMGPSYVEISKRYKGKGDSREKLTNSVLMGSAGKWGGKEMMPPHPSMSKEDVGDIVDYILSSQKGLDKNAPKGNLNNLLGRTNIANDGVLVRSSYTDKGNGEIPSLTDYKSVYLRNPYIPAYQIEGGQGLEVNHQIDQNATTIFPKGQNSVVNLGVIDLSNIKAIQIKLPLKSPIKLPNGTFKIRTGGSNKEHIGQNKNIERLEPGTVWVDIPIDSSNVKTEIYLDINKAKDISIEINGIMFQI